MADLAKAYVQIIPSARGIKAGLQDVIDGEMPSGGSSAGSVFGGSLVSKLKAIIATAGLGKALSATLTAGAELQQSLGGIETLFKDNTQTVIANAQQAYQTAGMSANAYMEQVTSFSASLLQSLGGDTAAAASVADMALRDMSDNANKFGTDMERITDAYQGFAKQNYTMLDNLKLGYGGTKTEMERLLADAQALTGVEYDINNLSDVYNAIHAIQGELGVTGTTAQEAASTLTGSFNSMKAAFTNVLGGLTLGQDIGPALNALAQTTTTFLTGNLLPAVVNIFSALPGAIATLLKALIPKNVQGVITSLVSRFTAYMTTAFPQLLNNGTQMLTQLMTGFQAGFPQLMLTMTDLMTQITGAIIQNLPTILQSGTTLLLQFILGIMTALPSLYTSVSTILTTILNQLMAALPSILATGASFILNLVSGVIQSLPSVVSSATSVISSLLTTLTSHLPDLLAQGISLIGKLVAGMISMLPDIVTTATDIATNMVNTVMSTDWLGLGGDIVRGIVQGVKNAAGSLFQALKDLASQALQAAKDALGIGSPSKEFRDQVGRWIPAGVAEGVRNNLSAVRSAIQQVSTTATEGFNSALRMDFGTDDNSGPRAAGGGVAIVQNIYSQARTAAELMQEARYNAEMAVLLGV